MYDQKKFTGRSYRHYDADKFKTDFVNADWSNFDRSEDPTECWNIYYDIMSSVLEIDCPVKTFVIKNKDEAWLTPELKTRVAEKNFALKRARRTNSVLDWHAANTLKNIISTDLKEAHRVHVVEEVEQKCK